MDWLPVVSIIGLSIAVLVLGWTVVRNKRQQSPIVGEQTRQGQIDAPKDGSMKGGRDRSNSVSTSVGFPKPQTGVQKSVYE